MLESKNLIPFECQWLIATRANVVVTGVPLGWKKIYPKDNQRIFKGIENVQIESVVDGYLELTFDFRSFSAEELQLPRPAGKVVKKYKLNEDRSTLNPIEE